MSDRRRNLFVLLIVLGLIAGSAVVIFQAKPTKLGLDLQGERFARLPGQADQADGGHRRVAAARARHHARPRRRSASPSPSSHGPARTRSRSTSRASRTPSAPPTRSARPPSCSSTTGRRTSSTRTARPTNPDQRRAAAGRRALQRRKARLRVRDQGAREQPGGRRAALLRVRQGLQEAVQLRYGWGVARGGGRRSHRRGAGRSAEVSRSSRRGCSARENRRPTGLLPISSGSPR